MCGSIDSQHFVDPDIIFVNGNSIYFLKGEADPQLVGLRYLDEKAVIIAFPAA